MFEMPKFPSTLGSIEASLVWVQSALERKEILEAQGPRIAMRVEVDLRKCSCLYEEARFFSELYLKCALKVFAAFYTVVDIT